MPEKNKIYAVDDVICLWQEQVTDDKVVVLKEVMVTITDEKTGVRIDWTDNQFSTDQSLRGIGDDGKTYEKHWSVWPISQTQTFTDQWSMRDDGEGENKFWIPKEAVAAHNALVWENQRHGANFQRVDFDGNSVLPKGDLGHCKEHNNYFYHTHACERCWLEEARARREAS